MSDTRECKACGYGPNQCSYAMGMLLLKVINDEYVKPSRAKELEQRAFNLKADIGFLTNAEIAAKPEEESLEDLLS